VPGQRHQPSGPRGWPGTTFGGQGGIQLTHPVRVYQPQQAAPRAATVNFASIEDEPDTTDGEASGRIDEQVELVMPDEPAVEGEIPLIPSNEATPEVPENQLPDEVVEQLREVPVVE
jgi:hypothetical protein